MNKIEEPFYEMEIKTSGCFIEIKINDVFSFSNYDLGGMSVDWPINGNILESGEQQFEITVLPVEKGKAILKQATIEIKIFVKEANKQYLGRESIYEMEAVKFEDKLLPVYVIKKIFKAEVSYKNIGWVNSVDLSKENEDDLKKELWTNIKIIEKLLKGKSIISYKEYYGDRILEHNKSFYLTDAEIIENENSFFSGLPDVFESIPINMYQLVYYGNNKLVGFKSIKEPLGFVFKPVNPEEYGFTEMVLFHKRTPNTKLIPIR